MHGTHAEPGARIESLRSGQAGIWNPHKQSQGPGQLGEQYYQRYDARSKFSLKRLVVNAAECIASFKIPECTGIPIRKTLLVGPV